MDYKVIDIEGVGEVYADKLTSAGVTTVDSLLEATRTPASRKSLSEATGIAPGLILKWANHADLMRIPGIGPQFAELLEAAGVDTVSELSHRRADNLHAKIEEVNLVRHLTGRVPSETEVQKMIDHAKELPQVLKY